MYKVRLLSNNRTLSMEGCCLDSFRKTENTGNFHDKGSGYVHQYNETVREFHLHLSDSKLQNVATTTAHLYKLLARMFEKKKMISGGTMCNQTDGCKNQYSCSVAYYLMSFLSKPY